MNGMRTQATVEMKRAEGERLEMHQRMQEVTHLKTQLMHRKFEEIMKEVVAPERCRALRETEEVTNKTLCPETLPLEQPLAQTDLTEKDNSEIEKVIETLQMEETSMIAERLAEQEVEASLEVHEFADEATHWATERQEASQRRQELFNSRMKLPVKHAVQKLDALRLPAEKVAIDDMMTIEEFQPRDPAVYAPHTTGRGPTMQPNLWQNKNQPTGVQPVLRNSVVGTVSVHVGKSKPIRLRVYGSDDPEAVAKDFCLTYGKGAKARKALLAAITESMKFSESNAVDEDWVVVEDVHVVELDLRRM